MKLLFPLHIHVIARAGMCDVKSVSYSGSIEFEAIDLRHSCFLDSIKVANAVFMRS